MKEVQEIKRSAGNKEEKPDGGKMVAGPLPLQNRGPDSFSGRKKKKGSFFKVRF